MACLPCQRAYVTAAPASTQSNVALAWAGILAVLGGFFMVLIGRRVA